MTTIKKWLISEAVHEIMVKNAIMKFGFDRALSYELDEEGKLYARFGIGIDPASSSYFEGRVPDPGEVMDMAIMEKKEQLILDPERDPRCSRKKVKRDKTKPFAVVPVEEGDRVVSLITVNNWSSNRPLEDKWEVFKRMRESFAPMLRVF